MRKPSLERKQVEVRYDPFNLAVGYALIDGEWTACQSEFNGIFEGKTERQIMIIAAELNGREKRNDERRRTNAQKLARFIEITEETQATLLQRRKDAEQAHNASPAYQLPLENALYSRITTNTFDSWVSIKTEPTGDYK